MEFKISASEFQHIVKCIGVVSKSNAVDFTGRILIECANGTVTFIANNNNTSLIYKASNIEVINEGEVSFSFSKIKVFVSSFNPWDGKRGVKDFKLVSTERETILYVDNLLDNGKKSKSKLKITNFNSSTVPRPKNFVEPNFILNSDIFKVAINKVNYAINKDIDFSVSALSGVCLKPSENNVFYFAGTDGRVVSEYEVRDFGGSINEEIILVRDFITSLSRIVPENENLFWQVDSSSVSVNFNNDNITLIGKRVVGNKYPDYRTVFDKFDESIKLNKELLLYSLSPFTDVLDSDDHYRITLLLKDGVLNLFNENARTELELDVEKSLEFDIDVNGRLLLKTIDVIKDDTIILKFKSKDSNLIFDSESFANQKSVIVSLKKR